MKLKAFTEHFTEDEIRKILSESVPNMDEEVDFESFLRVSILLLIVLPTKIKRFHGKSCGLHFTLFASQAHLNLQAQATAKRGSYKRVSSFLKATTTTVHHSISESEKTSYVAHINNYLGEDPFLKKYLPIDPGGNDIFELAKDGVLLWYTQTKLAFRNQVSCNIIEKS